MLIDDYGYLSWKFPFFLFLSFCPLPLSSLSEFYGLYIPMVAFVFFFSFLLVFICPTRVLFSYQGFFFSHVGLAHKSRGPISAFCFGISPIVYGGVRGCGSFPFFFLSAREGKTSVLIRLQHF